MCVWQATGNHWTINRFWWASKLCKDGRTVLTEHRVLPGWCSSGENKRFFTLQREDPARCWCRVCADRTGCARGSAVWVHWGVVRCLWGVVRCLWGGNNHTDTQRCLHLDGSSRYNLCSCISRGKAATAFLAERWVQTFLMRPFPGLLHPSWL